MNCHSQYGAMPLNDDATTNESYFESEKDNVGVEMRTMLKWKIENGKA